MIDQTGILAIETLMVTRRLNFRCQSVEICWWYSAETNRKWDRNQQCPSLSLAYHSVLHAPQTMIPDFDSSLEKLLVPWFTRICVDPLFSPVIICGSKDLHLHRPLWFRILIADVIHVKVALEHFLLILERMAGGLPGMVLSTMHSVQ